MGHPDRVGSDCGQLGGFGVLFGVDHFQVADDAEDAVRGLRDVHVYAEVMLAGDHFRGAPGPSVILAWSNARTTAS